MFGIIGATFTWVIQHIAPIFLIVSPITSYSDQIYSIHKTRTSAGFSLDIPLIMLLASTLKVFYWFGLHFDTALLVQSIIMIVMQTLLLYVALTYRSTSYGSAPPPFAPAIEAQSISTTSSFGALSDFERPYNFWRWRTSTPYWRFLGYWIVSLIGLQLLFGQFSFFPSLLGMLALSIEALLPIPQLVANQTRRSCLGFRLSVLANWLVGDAFKMVFFLAKGADEVPWAFKLCGMFQAACDVALGVQFYAYGDGTSPNDRDVGRDIRWLRDKGWEIGQRGWEMMGLEKAEEGDLRQSNGGY